MKVQLKYSQHRAALDWCEKNISPRAYYLHSGAGGHGWKLFAATATKGDWFLHTDDPKHLTWFLLTLN